MGQKVLRMSETVIIYGASDIARELGVSRNVVSNWLVRHDDTPVPAYQAQDGRQFWTFNQRSDWRAWVDARKKVTS